MADSLATYPTGQIQIGAGDLQYAASASLSFKNNGKLVHTLRQSPSGIVFGVREADGKIETVVPSTGPEYNYAQQVNSGKKIQFRFKVPDKNVTVDGAFTALDLEVPLGDVVKMSLSFIGKVTAPKDS